MRFLSDNEFETPSSTSVDSRSILRVPSLASTAGSHETRPSARSEHEDCALALFEAKHQARSNNSNVRDFTGTPMRRQSILVANGSSPWATPPVRMHSGHGPPVFVNYRPEEMNLKAESWPFHPTNQAPVQWMGGGHPTTPPQRLGVRTQGMPPYSPIRIRSGRGARRLSMGNNNAPHVTSGPSTDPSPSKSFPVSNRGMGRRNVAAALSRQANAGNDELTMLSKTEDKDLLPSDILTDTQANAPATLNTQSSFDVQHFRAV